LDQRDRFLGDGRRLGRNGCDLVPDAAHFAGLQRGLIARKSKGMLFDVGGGEHGEDAGQPLGVRRIDRHEPGVRMPRAQDFPVSEPRQGEVVQVAGAPRDLLGAVFLRRRLTDDGQLTHATEPTRSRSCSIAMTSSTAAEAYNEKNGDCWNAKNSPRLRLAKSSFDSPGFGVDSAGRTRSLR